MSQIRNEINPHTLSLVIIISYLAKLLHVVNLQMISLFADISFKRLSAEGSEQWVVGVDTSGQLHIRLGTFN